MDIWDAGYTKRSVDFFLESIRSLKKQSGGQRWNAICEDAVDLFFAIYPEALGKNPFKKEQVWNLFFEPPSDKNDELYQQFSYVCRSPIFIDFFFQIIHSLLDPPANWWRDSLKKRQ